MRVFLNFSAVASLRKYMAVEAMSILQTIHAHIPTCMQIMITVSKLFMPDS